MKKKYYKNPIIPARDIKAWLPFFFGIGAQRSGTTWLAAQFRKHPQIGFSPIKELHFFDEHIRHREEHRNLGIRSKLKKSMAKYCLNMDDSELHRIRYLILRLEMGQDENRYRSYFEYLKTPQHRVFGELTPAYSLLKRSDFLRMLRVCPSAKFLFVMRDPVDRFWSNIRRIEHRVNPDRFDPRSQIGKCLESASFQLRTRYDRTLNELLEVVPRSDVLVHFFENLLSPDQSQFEMDRITHHLGIDSLKIDLTSPYNNARPRSLKSEDELLIANRFLPVYEYAMKHFPSEIPEHWKSRLRLVQQS